MILIIDDDIAVKTSLQLLLENEGYRIASANEPVEALAFLKNNTPELIILDLNFSIETTGREGMNLLQQIKKINDAIPIILLQVGEASNLP